LYRTQTGTAAPYVVRLDQDWELNHLAASNRNLTMHSRLNAVFSRLMAIVACCAVGRAADLARTADHDYEAPAPGTYTLPIVKPAADGAVLDSEGHAMRLHSLTHGRITVLSFIYTRCTSAKACPYATGVLNQLHRLSQEEPSLAKGLRLVSMSFDPAIDTPR